MELPDVIEQVSHLDVGARALWFEGRWYTWAELSAQGDCVLSLAAEAGLAEQESLGVVLRNDPACVAVLLSAFRARRPVLTFSPLLPDGALAEDIRACRPGVLVALAADWDRPGLLEAAAAAGAAGLRAGGALATRVPGTGYVRRQAC
jgi:acyl-CoA synthetase (AMP-forming)/AMP-acid ligase II